MTPIEYIILIFLMFTLVHKFIIIVIIFIIINFNLPYKGYNEKPILN